MKQMLRKLRAMFGPFMPTSPWKRSATRTSRRARLGVEPLESRTLPATLLWTATMAGTWNDDNNWRDPLGAKAIPNNGDTLIFNPGQSVPGGAVGTNLDSTNNITVKVAEIDIASGYTKTIQLEKPLGVGQNENGKASNATSFQAGGILTGTGKLTIYSGATFNWGGGVWDSPAGEDIAETVVDSGATLNIQLNAYQLGRKLTNAGTVFQTTSLDLMVMKDGVTIDNALSGKYYLTLDKGITYADDVDTSTTEFLNYGRLEKTYGTSSSLSRIDIPFSNRIDAAVLSVDVGTLFFMDTAMQFSGTTNVSWGATLGVSDTFLMTAGTFNGSPAGTLDGNLLMTGGTFNVCASSNAGTFTVTHDYKQTGGTMYFDVGMFLPPRLAVGGTVYLSGNLVVNTIGGIPPNPVTIISGARWRSSPGYDFDSVTWLGEINYTVDQTQTNAYVIIPQLPQLPPP